MRQQWISAITIVVCGFGLGCRDPKREDRSTSGESPFGRLTMDLIVDLTSACTFPLQFTPQKDSDLKESELPAGPARDLYSDLGNPNNLHLTCSEPAPDLSSGQGLGWRITMTHTLQIFHIAFAARLEDFPARARALIAIAAPPSLRFALNQSLEMPADGAIEVDLDPSQQKPLRILRVGHRGYDGTRVDWSVDPLFPQ